MTDHITVMHMLPPTFSLQASHCRYHQPWVVERAREALMIDIIHSRQRVQDTTDRRRRLTFATRKFTSRSLVKRCGCIFPAGLEVRKLSYLFSLFSVEKLLELS